MVHFTVGDGLDEPVRSSSKEKSSGIVRSYSQDTNMLLAIEDKTTSSSFPPKTSYSENSLDSSNQDRQQKVSPTTASTTSINSTTAMSATGSNRKSLKETQSTVDEETLSTDSNSTADNDELKRRRRKILFAFRKNKTKVTL